MSQEKIKTKASILSKKLKISLNVLEEEYLHSLSGKVDLVLDLIEEMTGIRNREKILLSALDKIESELDGMYEYADIVPDWEAGLDLN